MWTSHCPSGSIIYTNSIQFDKKKNTHWIPCWNLASVWSFRVGLYAVFPNSPPPLTLVTNTTLVFTQPATAPPTTLQKWRSWFLYSLYSLHEIVVLPISWSQPIILGHASGANQSCWVMLLEPTNYVGSRVWCYSNVIGPSSHFTIQVVIWMLKKIHEEKKCLLHVLFKC